MSRCVRERIIMFNSWGRPCPVETVANAQIISNEAIPILRPGQRLDRNAFPHPPSLSSPFTHNGKRTP